ncbi:hypothetical protein CB1_000548009 [Camelus ferus]|nr:hypothetical protein CB1_000548009 [Camelus ferus]
MHRRFLTTHRNPNGRATFSFPTKRVLPTAFLGSSFSPSLRPPDFPAVSVVWLSPADSFASSCPWNPGPGLHKAGGFPSSTNHSENVVAAVKDVTSTTRFLMTRVLCLVVAAGPVRRICQVVPTLQNGCGVFCDDHAEIVAARLGHIVCPVTNEPGFSGLLRELPVSPLPSLLIRDTTEYVSCSRKSWSGLAALRRRTLQRCRGPGTRTPLFPVKTCSYRLASVTRLSQPRNTLSSDFCLTRGKPGAGK